MRFFVTAKLADGIDLGKKLVGGRKKAAVQQERSAFFSCVAQGFWKCGGIPFLNPVRFFRTCNVTTYCIGKCYDIKKIGNQDTFETIRFAQHKAPQRFQKRVLLSSVPDGVGQLPMLKLSVEKHPGFSHWYLNHKNQFWALHSCTPYSESPFAPSWPA